MRLACLTLLWSLSTGCVFVSQDHIDDREAELDADGDGHVPVLNGGADCDDGDASVFPGAPERCNGVDDDCDGDIDDSPVDPPTWYGDADGDGFAGDELTEQACIQPEGFSDTAPDCDDLLSSVHPGADEGCDGLDSDCDGVIPASEVDIDGDGASACAGDCEPANDTVGADTVGYVDSDADGFAGSTVGGTWCADMSLLLVSDDCDDLVATTHPFATELCNGVDDDCDGAVDDGALDALLWYADADQDGFGDAASTQLACQAPAGFVSAAGDCEVAVGTAYPGSRVPEVPLDGIDQNCDGLDVCTDLDCDGLPDIAMAANEDIGGEPVRDVPMLLSGGGSFALGPGLPGMGTSRAVVADYNADGYLDIAFSNTNAADGPPLVFADESYVYWGSATGHSAANRTSLPFRAAAGACTGDFNGDGVADLVLVRAFDGDRTTHDAGVWHGGTGGLTASGIAGLESISAPNCYAADLNSDGHDDLLFPSNISVEIVGGVPDLLGDEQARWYAGGSDGLDPASRVVLPVANSSAAHIHDVDSDGHLDVVLAVTRNSSGEPEATSLVYWGSADGPQGVAVASLDTIGATAVASGDLDGDGDVDLVFASTVGQGAGLTNTNQASVYFNDGARMAAPGHLHLPSSSSRDVEIADLNGDGYPEIVFANFRFTGGARFESWVYWGSPLGYAEINRAEFETVGASQVEIADYDADGYPDLFFTGRFDDLEKTLPAESRLYWGSAAGPYPTVYTAFQTVGVINITTVGGP